MSNHEQIKKDLQRATKTKSFIKKRNWKRIDFPSEKDDWKKFEKNNLKLFLVFCMLKKGKIYFAYVSKHTSNSEKQVTFLMIPNGEG